MKLESFKFFWIFQNSKQLHWKFFFPICRTTKYKPADILPSYFTRKLVSPPLFDKVNDTLSQNLLQKNIERDIAWSIAGLPDKEKRMLLLGSWTSFQKETAIGSMKNSKISYLPTIHESWEYPVCKTYLHFLVDTIEVLELSYIFVKADEQVYAMISHIIWKHRDFYSKIIPIMDGFHQMRIFQRFFQTLQLFRFTRLVCWFRNNYCWIS